MCSETVSIERCADQLDSNDIVKLIQSMFQYRCSITFHAGTVCVNASSMMGMLALQMRPGMEVTVSAQGEDENDALQEACRWLRAGHQVNAKER